MFHNTRIARNRDIQHSYVIHMGLNTKNVIDMIQDLKGLSQETTLVLSNTRELDRVPSTE